MHKLLYPIYKTSPIIDMGFCLPSHTCTCTCTTLSAAIVLHSTSFILGLLFHSLACTTYTTVWIILFYNRWCGLFMVSSPFLLRDGSGNGVDSAGVVWLARDIPAQDGTHQVERQNDKQTDTSHCHLQSQTNRVYNDVHVHVHMYIVHVE